MLRLIKKLHAYNNTLSSAILELVHTRKIKKIGKLLSPGQMRAVHYTAEAPNDSSMKVQHNTKKHVHIHTNT